ncbi:MAG: MlaD family protein [Tepidamorphaceae bacterium]|nr:MCE family protein [Rhodobiaceae bacterium]MCC0049999.1 MCE family protein [Rhodobiaceae bacterium]
METRASPFIVGLFTLGTLFALIAFTYWYSRFGEGGPEQTYRVVFADEVTGLGVGAPVLFNGIKVGSVEDMGLAPDDPTQIVARITVGAATPVRVDTRAQIQSQGFTGVPFIQLISGRPDAPELTQAWGGEGAPIIYADASTVQSIIDRAQSLMTKLDTAVTRVDDILAGNQAGINNSIRNIEKFSAALAERSDAIGSFMDDAAAVARRLNALGEKLETLSTSLQERLDVISPDSVRQTVENVKTFTAGLADQTDELKAFISDAGAAAKQLAAIADKIDPVAIESSIKNIESFTSSLGGREEQIAKFFDDASAVAAQFRETSKRIDGIVSGFSESEGGSLITEVTAAAKSFRKLSDQLSGKGLRNLESLVNDGRRTLATIDRVMNSIERNPGRFLTGGSQVRESGGNRR